MQISVTDPNSLQSAKERFNAFWKVTMKKRIVRIIWLRPLIGVFFVIIGISSECFTSFTSHKILPTGEMVTFSHTELHVALSLGIVFLIYSAFDFLRVRREKNYIFQQYNLRVGAPINYHLTDESITEDHFGMTRTFQWQLFSNCIDHKGFLLLIIAASVPSIVINKSLFSEAQLNEFTAFLRERKFEKKVNSH